MVPQTKPKESYQMFYNFINNRPINTPVWDHDRNNDSVCIIRFMNLSVLFDRYFRKISLINSYVLFGYM